VALETRVKRTFFPFLLLLSPETRDNHSKYAQETQAACTKYPLIFEAGSGIFSWRGEMNLRLAQPWKVC